VQPSNESKFQAYNSVSLKSGIILSDYLDFNEK